jgi:hypothetical protein
MVRDGFRAGDAVHIAAQAPPYPSERGSGGRKDPSSSLRTAGDRMGSPPPQEVPVAGCRKPFIICANLPVHRRSSRSTT